MLDGAGNAAGDVAGTVPPSLPCESFAGAYLGMCCKDTGADLVFAWPQATVTIVGAETAASVIFAKKIKNAENSQEVRAARIGEYRDLFENPYCAAERGYIDDVIMPSN